MCVKSEHSARTMTSEDSAFVKFEGDNLSVVEKPPRDCKAVVEARDNMLGVVDLDGVLSHFVTVGKFFRTAYNGVAGDTELQIAVRELLYDIAELCEDSNLTIRKFGKTADSVLTDLTGAYRFFLDDMEEMGIVSIDSVGDATIKMAGAALQLCDRFKYEKRKVLNVCKDTARKEGLKANKAGHVRELAIPAVHSAVGALSNLAIAMQKAATFWKSMQQVCEEQFSQRKLEMLFKAAIKYEDHKKRLRVYESWALKRHAVKEYVSWVAMEAICDDYIKNTEVFREEIHTFLSENPTIEESKQCISQLCKTRVEEANAKMINM